MDLDYSPTLSNVIVRNYSWENAPAGAPGKLFVNPSEIFVIKTYGDGAREFSLWIYHTGMSNSAGGVFDRPYVKDSSFYLAPDERIDPNLLLRLLKAGGGSAPVIKSAPLSINNENLRKDVIIRFLSTEELVTLFRGAINGLLPYGEAIVADATSVVKDAKDLELLEAADIVAEMEERLSSAAIFEVVTPEGQTVDIARSETPERKLTLQEIEDEHEPEYVTLPKALKRKRPNYWILALFAVVALAVGWAAVSFLPTLLPDSNYTKGEEMVVDDNQPAILSSDQQQQSSEDPSEQLPEETDVITADMQESEPEQTSAPPVANSPEAQDIQYLNDNNVWERAALKSDKYKAFFDLLSTGDIRKIAESDYFAVSGNMKNPTAEKVINLLWGALDSGTQKANEKQMQNLADQPSIDLDQLYGTLARYRDKKPNTSPRPVK